MPDSKKFFTTQVPDEGEKLTLNFNDGVISYIKNQLQYFETARREKEEIWLECWAMYLGSEQSRNHVKSRIARSLGNVNTDWRHNIVSGKAFEQVETVLAYLQQAFFPNRDWFDAVPLMPGAMDLSKVVKEFTNKKLVESQFISHWEIFLRQMLIVGSSVIALPWRFETVKWKKRVRIENPNGGVANPLPHGKKVQFKVREEERIIQNQPDFEVLDMFDCYLDPRAIDVNTSDFVRRLIKTKSEVSELITSGYYKNISVLDVVKTPNFRQEFDAENNTNLIKKFQGYEITEGFHWTQNVELFEYWGDITVDGTVYKDVVATIMGDNLLRFENNPYWCGKPFILGTYTPVVRSTAALGVIEPSLGMLHELDIVTNQRLDNLELSVDTMFEYVNDGTLQPEDIYTKPGRVFSVAQPDTLRPIVLPQNFTITYDESAVLETRIDKNAGTGNLISSNSARDAERVTAAEVQATRDAGGNRLSGLHKHIEETALLRLLDKLFRLFQQFVTEDEVVRVPGEAPGNFDFVAVGAEELGHDFKLLPVGADHVADKEFEVAQRLQFLQVVSSNPEMSQHINYFNFMIDLARRMGIDDVDQFIQENQQGGGLEQLAQQTPELQAQSGEQVLQQELAQTGGNTLASTIGNDLNSDGGQNLLASMFGVDPGVATAPNAEDLQPQ